MDTGLWLVIVYLVLAYIFIANIRNGFLDRKLEKERLRNLHKKLSEQYEQRKQAIGRIVCPQCKWTGNWGDGMSYEEFFIYELVEVNKVRVSHRVDTNIHVLNSESQYKCPVCKSTNWQKV